MTRVLCNDAMRKSVNRDIIKRIVCEKCKSMASHDKQFLKDIKSYFKPSEKVFDMNGNLNYNCYILQKSCSTIRYPYEIFVYKDGSFQISDYLKDEPIYSSW